MPRNGCCFLRTWGPHLAIDESYLSNGELYTLVTNRDRHTHEESLVAVVSGTKSEDVIQVLRRIGVEEHMKVKEVTLDLSNSMRRIASTVFPKAKKSTLPYTETDLRGCAGTLCGTPLLRCLATEQRGNGRM